MRILGIDPGTISTGIGVVDSISGELSTPYHSVIKTRKNQTIEQRLTTIYDAIEEIILEMDPDEVAIEEPFVSENPRTAIAIGQAQATALIKATKHEKAVTRYAAREIKKSVTNNGGSSKHQVKSMVEILLGNIEIQGPDDISDALAVAICHHNSKMIQGLTFNE